MQKQTVLTTAEKSSPEAYFRAEDLNRYALAQCVQNANNVYNKKCRILAPFFRMIDESKNNADWSTLSLLNKIQSVLNEIKTEEYNKLTRELSSYSLNPASEEKNEADSFREKTESKVGWRSSRKFSPSALVPLSQAEEKSQDSVETKSEKKTKEEIVQRTPKKMIDSFMDKFSSFKDLIQIKSKAEPMIPSPPSTEFKPASIIRSNKGKPQGFFNPQKSKHVRFAEQIQI